MAGRLITRKDNKITATALAEQFGKVVVVVNGRETTINKNGVVQLVDPAVEQNNASVVAQSNVSVQSYQPGNTIIRAGQVDLHKISQYLTDLPADAKAELLVAPQDLQNIDDSGLGTWKSSIKRIRQIEGYQGLDGMKIFDRPETAPDVTYEQSLAEHIKAAFNQAQIKGKPVTTGLFLGTKQLVHGREIGSRNITVENNLYSLRDKVGEQGDAFITRHGSVSALWQWSGTENPDNSSYVYGVDFTDGVVVWGHKDGLRLSARPVALTLQP